MNYIMLIRCKIYHLVQIKLLVQNTENKRNWTYKAILAMQASTLLMGEGVVHIHMFTFCPLATNFF